MRSLYLRPALLGITCFVMTALMTSAAHAQAAAPPPTSPIFTVNSTADTSDANPGDGVCADRSGACTLRAAIQEVNTGPSPLPAPGATYTIKFNISTGAQTIVVNSALPAITKSVTIDGTTQPTYGGTPLIFIKPASSTAIAVNGAGLELDAGSDGSTIKALGIIGFTNTGNSGIHISGSSSNLVQGCYIGVNSSSAVSSNETGVLIDNSSTNNVIGGTTTATRNIISGNTADGVDISGNGVTGNVIEGNYIGTNVGGTASVQNGIGVNVEASASGNTIGGTAAGAGNVISGNMEGGVSLNAANNNTVEGNLIGADATGSTALGNGTVGGVGIVAGAQGNTIGGTTAAARNIISGNTPSGVLIDGRSTNTNIIEGNYIGTDVTGSMALPNNQDGVLIDKGAQGNSIGGTGAGAGNVISGNGLNGINIQGTASAPQTSLNVVQGNTIGLCATGTSLPNQGSGVSINTNAQNNTIGGGATGAGNVISGNNNYGVEIGLVPAGDNTGSNTVQGNYIGTDASSTTGLGNNLEGIHILGSNSNLIGTNGDGINDVGERNFIAGNGRDGIYITGSNSNVVQGNYIGTNVNGTSALGNGAVGVEVRSGAQTNAIGGAASGLGNVISGNIGDAISIGDAGTSHNTVQGNLLGTDVTGTVALANGGSGVDLFGGTQGNTVGGTTSAARNIISGNKFQGVALQNPNTNSNIVQGNFIGIDITGTSGLANGGDGVAIYDSASNNTVGGIAAGEGNKIGHNKGAGVRVTDGTTPSSTIGNSIRGNAISDNNALGINLVGGTENSFGVTANDAGDTDTGPNNLQNFPVINYATQSGTNAVVDGTLDTTAVNGTVYSLDFYSTPATDIDPSGFGQGETYVTSTNVTVDATGHAAFNLSLTGVAAGNYITATATLTTGSLDTSEFSKANLVQTSNVVVNTNDTGAGSLRNALNFAHNNAPQTVTFNIPTSDPNFSGGVWTISPGSALPTLDQNTTIVDGYSQPGSTVNTLSVGDNAVLKIVLNGTSAGASANGLTIQDASNCVVKGLVINNFKGNGVSILDPAGGSVTANNSVTGCFLGTNAAGTTGAANVGDGIKVSNGATNTSIGSAAVADRNIISGNAGAGIQLDAVTSSNVQGNYIGTQANGTTQLANTGVGVDILNLAVSNQIGGTTGTPGTGAGNIISGNGTSGITIEGGQNNTVLGNSIGMGATGNALFNGDRGVLLWQSSAADVTIGNVIGGTTSTARNLISGNVSTGVELQGSNTANNSVIGNYIGTDAAGSNAQPNAEGVLVWSNAHNNKIGDAVAGAGNLIAGNGTSGGVGISGAKSNTVQNNSIGLNAAGTAALANQGSGITLDGDAQSNQIGGNTNTNALARNIISGNVGPGINIQTAAAPGPSSNTISGNYIGLDAAGANGVANQQNGINMTDNCTSNIIGGSNAGEGNVISGNGGHGVALSGNGTNNNQIKGNLIGVNSTDTAAVKNSFDGITVLNGPLNTVIGGIGAADGNVLSGNGGNGLSISNSSNSTVQGNFIGTDQNGTASLANAAGVIIEASAQANIIGGTTAAARNIISGNTGVGVHITDFGTTGNLVEGNFIGTNKAGTSALHNGDGVVIAIDADNNTIGGTTTGAGNVISGNTLAGIDILSPTATTPGTPVGNTVQGNFLGTNATGVSTVPNGTDGVDIFGGAIKNLIGGTTAGAGNIISGNSSGAGIEINGTGTNNNLVQGNFIGTNTVNSTTLGNDFSGVSIFSGAQNNVIGGISTAARNIISGNGTAGIEINGTGTSNNSVQGNYIGTDTTGASAVPNKLDGVFIGTGASSNTIGGTTAAARNIISGSKNATGNSGVGVEIGQASNNTVAGNFIGTNAAGTAAIPNAVFGVLLGQNAQNNIIGGSTTGAGNLISGNVNDGINLQGNANGTQVPSGNQILGNFIGTDAGGTGALPNLRGVNLFNGAKNNIIGSLAAGNTIAFNTGSGVQVGQGVSTVNATGNTIRGNTIFSNGGLGINLQPSGEAANVVTANDAGDADTGPNNLQNFPVITNVTTNGGQTIIGGTLNSIANNTFAIDFYRNTTEDSTGSGEGEVYIGSQNATTNGSGNASFSLTINGTFAGQFFTATATNTTSGSSFGDTSEFAQDQTSTPAALRLNIVTSPATTPPTFSEGAGSNAAIGTVTRNTFTGSDLVVTLTSSNTGKVTVPATVTIPAGQTSVTFPISAVDNAVADGSQNVKITASATGHNPDSTTVVVTDNDTAGIIVAPTTGLTTTSTGGTATFTVKLNSQPVGNVTIGLSSSNTNQGTVSPATLTFTPQNYNLAQTVTVTGANDQSSSTNQTYKITLDPAGSNDAGYKNLAPVILNVTNVYSAGAIIVTPTTGLTTTEAGGTATFTVSLSSKPGSNVTIPLSSSNSGEGTVAPASLLFTPQNFNVPQTVTVKGVDDQVADGDQTYTINVGPATSSDVQYNGQSGAAVTVVNKDNDAVGFVVTPTAGLKTTKSGGQAIFTVKLKSQPTNNVRLGLRSSNPQQGVVSPVTLLFTPANWNVAQQVTITGVNNHKQEAPQLYQIITFSLSADAKYNRLPVPNVQVTNEGTNTVGFTVFPLTGLTTTSGGGSDSFAMRLNTQPTAKVTIPVSSSDTGQGTVTPTVLVFTPANWRTPQHVTVQGVNSLAAGAITYHILLGPAQSSDQGYNGLTPPSVTVVNLHQRKAGFFVTPQAGLTTTEQGGTATFTIKLNSQPTSIVTIGLSSSNLSNGTVSPSIIIFNRNNWNAPHTVTVTGAADNAHSLHEPYEIITTPAVSSDTQYNGLNPPDVQVTNIDNNGKPTITLTPLTATLLVGQQQQFLATVTGLGKVAVNWQVQESDSGGTITTDGLYTAPDVPGRYHVVVSVVGHPDLVATAVVNVVTQTSVAFSWGDNTFGELGIGNHQDQPLPQLVNNITDVLTVAAGGSHSLALTKDGLVHAWGYNGAGQLGDGTNEDRLSPVTVDNLAGVRAVAAGWYHSLALKQDGTVWAWGLNQSGQLGDGTNNDSSLPVQVQNLRNVQAIAAGVYFSLALKQDGTVWAWGSNFYGQLGDGTTNDTSTPVQVADLTGVRAISAGTAHSVALMADGSVRTWGWNHYGQLGNGQPDDSTTPTTVSSPTTSTGTLGSTNLTGVQAVAAGYAHTLFLLKDGTILSCGNNAYGQLGDESQNTRRIPVPVNDLTGVKAIAAGAGHSLALLMDGSVFGWGDNSHGQLGGSKNAHELEPVAVERIGAIKAIAAGYKHSLAVNQGMATSAAALAALRLSNGQADATKSIVVLDFVEALNSLTAADASHYSVLSSGHAVRVESASYNVSQHRVIVSVPEGSLHRGDSVILSWNGMHTAKGVLMANGSTILIAR
ncbi:MAG: CSLREA domain-containing protein [Abitibacteriaceae bacterium]|nr:CSLREA domain-containing protein [Abditibacteriaceae bacterium]